MHIFFLTTPEYAQDITKHLPDLETTILFDEDKKTVQEYVELFEDTEEKIVVIAPNHFSYSFPNETIDAIPNLKGIVTRSAWGNYIDMKHAKEKGIAVANAPGANSQSVAEYAILQMLGLLRKFPLQMKEQFEIKHDKEHQGEELLGKTVGILGLGRIGTRIANLCHGMGTNVIYWSRTKKSVEYDYYSLEEVLTKADIIFKTWEIIPDTNGLLHKDNLQLLKPTAYFISVFGGIGWSDDDVILLDMVQNGRLAGFSVENEHKKDADVKEHYDGNIFLPGAYAWATRQTQERYGKITAESIIGIIEDKEINRVNP